MLVGRGSVSTVLTSTDVEVLLAEALQAVPSAGQRVLVIIPDGTRTAPIPLLFRLLNDQLGPHVEKLDFLIALGTHPLMSEDQIAKLVGMSPVERVESYPRVRIFNHQWNSPEMLVRIGVIPPQEAVRLTDGLLAREVPITLNRLVLEYDHLRVTLATEISKERCQQVNLGYVDYREIDPTHWLGREHEGVLVIANAGEVLYRIGSSAA
jgi:lactate racemase